MRMALYGQRARLGVMLLAWCVAPALSLAAPNVRMYLKIEGIPGESAEQNHPNWIQIQAFSHGVAKSAAMGQTGTQPSQHQDFAVMKELDRASPRIFLASCLGTQISSVTLHLVRPADGVKFMDIGMTNVVIASAGYNATTSSTVPVEQVTFNYQKIRWSYSWFDESGALLEVVTTSWDVLGNRPAAARPSALKLR